MVQINELCGYLDRCFTSVSDYAPNGLQVSGRDEVAVLVTGVTACQALIERAVEQQADAVLVHHGLFWRGDDPCVVGMKAKRLRSLLTHGINLIAYHLPLDVHPDYGNNVQLGQRLGFVLRGTFDCVGVPNLGCWGTLKQPMSGEDLQAKLTAELQHPVLLVAGHQGDVERVAWCTGAAQDGIEQAAKLGVHAYITGEASERTVHQARELGLHLLVAGHHATERYGVQAVGEDLAKRFGLKHMFIDIPNPV